MTAMVPCHFDVAHALVRAASALLPTPGFLHANGCRDESRHGTHECVRHICRRLSHTRHFPKENLTRGS